MTFPAHHVFYLTFGFFFAGRLDWGVFSIFFALSALLTRLWFGGVLAIPSSPQVTWSKLGPCLQQLLQSSPFAHHLAIAGNAAEVYLPSALTFDFRPRATGATALALFRFLAALRCTARRLTRG
jgi:hypothetical protein